MSLGSRGGEVLPLCSARSLRQRHQSASFSASKGRFGHPFINHEARIRTPMIRYKKGRQADSPQRGMKRFVMSRERLDAVAEEHGRNAIGVVGSPRLTNEALYVLRRFTTELVGTENYTTTDCFSLRSFFQHLGGPLATHRDIRYAKTIVLIGGDPSELQPLTGKQIRQACETAARRSCSSIPFRFACANRRKFSAHQAGTKTRSRSRFLIAADSLAAQKAGVERNAIARTPGDCDTHGDVVVMFGRELSQRRKPSSLSCSQKFATRDRRILFHPLPLFNNSIGAHDMGMMDAPTSRVECSNARAVRFARSTVAAVSCRNISKARGRALETRFSRGPGAFRD
jgi:hypothetical protein